MHKIVTILGKKAIKIDGEEVGESPLPSGSEFLKYTVKEGETAFDIALKFDVNPYKLWHFLVERYGSDSLYPGQEIEIPFFIVKKKPLDK